MAAMGLTAFFANACCNSLVPRAGTGRLSEFSAMDRTDLRIYEAAARRQHEPGRHRAQYDAQRP
jgi:hypothetical protein